MTDTWRAHLTTLRNQFESAAMRYPQLSCVLVYVRDRKTVGSAIEACPHKQAAATWQIDYHIHGRGVRCFWLTMEDRHACEIFSSLANKAGRVLESRHRQDFHRFGISDAVWAVRGVSRWVSVLFDVAWCQPSSFPVQADRYPIKKDHWDKMFKAAFAKGDHEEARRIHEAALDEACYASMSGVFGASVDVIDVMLTENTQDDHASATQQLPERGGSKAKYDSKVEARLTRNDSHGEGLAPEPVEHSDGMTLTYLVNKVGRGVQTLRNAATAAKVRRSKQGQHSYVFPWPDIVKIAKADMKKNGNSKASWEPFLEKYASLIAAGKTPTKLQRNSKTPTKL